MGDGMGSSSERRKSARHAACDSSRPPADGRLIAGLQNVVLGIGRSDFGQLFFDAMRDALRVEQAIVFRLSRTRRWEILLAENARGRGLADDLACSYVRHYHTRDPNREILRPTAVRSLRTRTLATSEFADPSYRAHLFADAGLAGKIAIIASTPNEILYLNLYRTEGDGSFTRQEALHFLPFAGLVAGTVERHFALLQRPERHTLESLRGVLAAKRDGRPSLSARETEVCALGLAGRSIEAIALELSLSRHSVFTYRRRAFAKLGISTSQQLFALALC
jgi:DNA-binding CsgD family transcriptional regulator